MTPIRIFSHTLLLITGLNICLSCGEDRKPASSQVAETSVQEEEARQSASSAGDEALLWQAALEGHSKELKSLIGKGADVNAMDENGRTALMYAAFNGHSAIVLELIEHGALVDRRDLLGRSALFFASTGPFAETVSILIDKGAQVNLVDLDEHFTPLMHAAAEGNLDVVKLLIGAGADPSLKDVDGDDALSFARQSGHTHVVEYLNSL